MTNTTLTLARDGIFPITKSVDDNLVTPVSGLAIAGTIQGEGIWAGTPSLFVRLQGCNLRCIWSDNVSKAHTCDTAYTSIFPSDAKCMSIDNVYKTLEINRGKINHVVITGDEPLLQSSALLPLVDMLHSNNWRITIETNGTIWNEQVAHIIPKLALLSISPKLPSSIPTSEKLDQFGIEATDAIRKHSSIISNYAPLQNLVVSAAATTQYQLKFVVASSSDEIDIKRILRELPSDCEHHVVVMPMGTDTHEMRNNALAATEMAIRNGWRYSPRLHIDIFGNKEGV